MVVPSPWILLFGCLLSRVKKQCGLKLIKQQWSWWNSTLRRSTKTCIWNQRSLSLPLSPVLWLDCLLVSFWSSLVLFQRLILESFWTVPQFWLLLHLLQNQQYLYKESTRKDCHTLIIYISALHLMYEWHCIRMAWQEASFKIHFVIYTNVFERKSFFCL